jgi:hypothetical protein
MPEVQSTADLSDLLRRVKEVMARVIAPQAWEPHRQNLGACVDSFVANEKAEALATAEAILVALLTALTHGR